MTFQIQRYKPEDAGEWNEFLSESRNGTFLLDRGYMDYHADRFHDHSLLLRGENGRLAAVLPANQQQDGLHSHAGLTYGGLVIGPKSGAGDVMKMIAVLREHMRVHGLRRLHYKSIPWIYHRQPSEDDRFALYKAGAQLTRRDVLSVIARENRLHYQERRARGIKAARKAGLQTSETNCFADFWAILTDALQTRHGVAPVHTLPEIEMLHRRFPNSIRLFGASRDGAMVAGVVIYETERVAHAQYISASDSGRELRALDLLFDAVLTTTYADKPYVDFGISNERNGDLNTGLVAQKEGFGARTVVHDCYELAS